MVIYEKWQMESEGDLTPCPPPEAERLRYYRSLSKETKVECQMSVYVSDPACGGIILLIVSS